MRRLTIFLSITTACFIAVAGISSYIRFEWSWVSFWFFFFPIYYVLNAVAFRGKSNYKIFTYAFTIIATVLLITFLSFETFYNLKAIFLRMTGQASTSATFADLFYFFSLIGSALLAIGTEVAGAIFIIQHFKKKKIEAKN